MQTALKTLRKSKGPALGPMLLLQIFPKRYVRFSRKCKYIKIENVDLGPR